MRSSEMCAWARKLAIGAKERSSFRRSLNSAACCSAMRPILHLRGGWGALLENRGAKEPAERRENRSDAQHEEESDQSEEGPAHETDRSSRLTVVLEHFPEGGRHVARHFQRALDHGPLHRLEQDADRNGNHEVRAGADQAGKETDEGAVARRNRLGLILLKEIRGD